MSGIVNSSASRVESLAGGVSCKSGGEATDVNNMEASLRFLVEAMAFLNAFVQSAPDLRNQVVIQWEVEEAALNVHSLSQVRDAKATHINCLHFLSRKEADKRFAVSCCVG